MNIYNVSVAFNNTGHLQYELTIKMLSHTHFKKQYVK